MMKHVVWASPARGCARWADPCCCCGGQSQERLTAARGPSWAEVAEEWLDGIVRETAEKVTRTRGLQ